MVHNQSNLAGIMEYGSTKPLDIIDDLEKCDICVKINIKSSPNYSKNRNASQYHAPEETLLTKSQDAEATLPCRFAVNDAYVRVPISNMK